MRRKRGELEALFLIGRGFLLGLEREGRGDGGRLGCLEFESGASCCIFHSTIITADGFHIHIDPFHGYAVVAQWDEIACVLHGHDSSYASDGKDVSLFEGMCANEREWGGVGEDYLADCEGGPVGAGFAGYGDDVNG